jgi:hypothetical protein
MEVPMPDPGRDTTPEPERAYRTVWTFKPTERFPNPETIHHEWASLAEAVLHVERKGHIYADMRVEVAEWRRLDSEAEWVEAAHQRLHEAGAFPFCPPEPVPCPARRASYAALDVDDPSIEGEMPWRKP